MLVLGEERDVPFDVETDFDDGRIFQQRLQRGERGGERDLLADIWRRLLQRAASDGEQFAGAWIGAAMRERDVDGVVGAERKRKPDELGARGVVGIGFGVEADAPAALGAGDVGFERGEIADGFVSVALELGFDRLDDAAGRAAWIVPRLAAPRLARQRIGRRSPRPSPWR